MAQTIVTYCDPCLARGEERLGVTWEISIRPPGARKPRAFAPDVCETCAKGFTDLLEFLGEGARPAEVEPAASPPSREPCPSCDYLSATHAGLVSHMRDKHETTLAEATGTADIPCQVRGCDRKFSAVQGLAVHMRRVHDRAYVRA